MSRPKMSALHRMQMREKILDSAWIILAQKGPEFISSRAVAENVNLTHMGLFSYFPNQAAILNALVEREQSKVVNEIRSMATRNGLDNCVSEIGNALVFLQDHAGKNPRLFQLAWTTPDLAGDGGSQPDWMRSTIDFFAGRIHAGQERDDFAAGDPEILAAMVIGMVHMPFILSVTGKVSSPNVRDQIAREALAEALEYLKRGATPRRNARESAWAAFVIWLRKRLGKIQP